MNSKVEFSVKSEQVKDPSQKNTTNEIIEKISVNCTYIKTKPKNVYPQKYEHKV
jgi:hypothetical protein